MPFYHKLGSIPPKRHTVFRQVNGAIYHEQLFGTVGFEGMSSLLYHVHPPTVVKEIQASMAIAPEIALEKHMTMFSLQGFQLDPTADFLASRTPVLVNSDCYIELAGVRLAKKSAVGSN